MAKKVIKIFGDITEESYNDFSQELSNVSESDTCMLLIRSFGGLLDYGWKMYEDIKHLQEKGTEVYALVDTVCMSSAVLPLLAVRPINRMMRKNAKVLIHQPYYTASEGTNLNLQTLKDMQNELDSSICNLRATYIREFDASELQINTLMTNEQVIGAELARHLGIVHSVVTTEFNRALKTNRKSSTTEGIYNRKKFTDKMKKEMSLVDKLIKVLEGVKMTNLMVISEEGVEIVVDAKNDGDALEVGDAVNGTPDGVYTVDNQIITIAEGKIADIQPLEEKPEGTEGESAEPAEPQEANKAVIKNEGEEGEEEPKAEGVTKEEFDALVARVETLEGVIASFAESKTSQDEALESLDAKLKSVSTIFRELKNAVSAEVQNEDVVTRDYQYYKSKGI